MEFTYGLHARARCCTEKQLFTYIPYLEHNHELPEKDLNKDLGQ